MIISPFPSQGTWKGKSSPNKIIVNQQEAVFNQVAGKARKSLGSALSFSNRVIISNKASQIHTVILFHDVS